MCLNIRISNSWGPKCIYPPCLHRITCIPYPPDARNPGRARRIRSGWAADGNGTAAPLEQVEGAVQLGSTHVPPPRISILASNCAQRPPGDPRVVPWTLHTSHSHFQCGSRVVSVLERGQLLLTGSRGVRPRTPGIYKKCKEMDSCRWRWRLAVIRFAASARGRRVLGRLLRFSDARDDDSSDHVVPDQQAQAARRHHTPKQEQTRCKGEPAMALNEHSSAHVW